MNPDLAELRRRYRAGYEQVVGHPLPDESKNPPPEQRSRFVTYPGDVIFLRAGGGTVVPGAQELSDALAAMNPRVPEPRPRT